MSTSFIPPVIDQLSDADLMASILLGDEDAFRSLYDRHSPIVFALCRRILDDRRDAEDVLQEVFWEIWDRASRYDPKRGSVRTYVVMLARCRAIDRARQTHRQQEVTVTSLQATRLFSSEKSHHTPPCRVSEEEQRRLLSHGLNGLDDPQREALELAFFDGLSHRQIATQLDTPLGTIKTRIRNALLKLRNSLAALDDHEALS